MTYCRYGYGCRNQCSVCRNAESNKVACVGVLLLAIILLTLFVDWSKL